MNSRQRFIYYSSPEHWFQTALELDSSVEDLNQLKDSRSFIQNIEPDIERSIKRPAPSKAILLLMAYSLENLLKGIHVLRDASLVNKGKLQSKIATHQLNNLSDSLDIGITDQEKDFQNLLSKQSISNARYPIGKNENIESKPPIIENRDYEIYKSLFEKYKWILVNEFHEFGWDSGTNHESLNTAPKEFNYVELE